MESKIPNECFKGAHLHNLIFFKKNADSFAERMVNKSGNTNRVVPQSPYLWKRRAGQLFLYKDLQTRLYWLDKQDEKKDRIGSETVNTLGAMLTIDIMKWKRSKQTTLKTRGEIGQSQWKWAATKSVREKPMTERQSDSTVSASLNWKILYRESTKHTKQINI